MLTFTRMAVATIRRTHANRPTRSRHRHTQRPGRKHTTGKRPREWVANTILLMFRVVIRGFRKAADGTERR